MARRRKAIRRSKRVNYKIIRRELDASQPEARAMYELLDQLVAEHHDDIRHARIALAWNTSWRPDADGRVTLGKCKKASDLDRELAPFDFVIMLRREFWTDPTVTDAQRAALLDHELCHATIALDKHGEPIIDDRGRKCYRIRKHDLEEFAEIAARHGMWKRDIEAFAAALRRAPEPAEQQQELTLVAPAQPAAAAAH